MNRALDPSTCGGSVESSLDPSTYRASVERPIDLDPSRATVALTRTLTKTVRGSNPAPRTPFLFRLARKVLHSVISSRCSASKAQKHLAVPIVMFILAIIYEGALVRPNQSLAHHETNRF